ncbi:hypothetical protein [Burkholderia multivorans]|uniref:hypothetical protein n=1 Tax=Burkholderia multivorans TaxID=87883 RepID=UPI001C2739C6|nr:hypothetical protein [Burkholderia multivorans]MBU9542853.1 hypothetical protein [Burkholderia multivorans]
MKTTICILKLEDWKFKTEQGQELQGKSAVYLLEDYDLNRTTLKDDLLVLVQKSTLPATFEADLKAVQKFNNGKAKLKYEINSLKLINSVKVFN